MGGYGHSRAREFMFGGFTRRILHRAPLPVFLSH
jgi:nucleotide-binding universal stress UspA family protein